MSVGSNGAIRAHCASENQKKSAIFNASSLETLNHTITALGIPFMGPDPSSERVAITHHHVPYNAIRIRITPRPATLNTPGVA